jgi:hypothetical protein
VFNVTFSNNSAISWRPVLVVDYIAEILVTMVFSCYIAEILVTMGQLLAHGRWFSPGTPASSTTKTGRHDIAELLLKVTLNTKNQSISINHFDVTGISAIQGKKTFDLMTPK